MLIKEFRIPLPFTVDEYRIGQLYMTARGSREETEGGEGVEVIKNEPYTNGEELDKDVKPSGQYTYKIMHIASKLPGWLRRMLPKSALEFHEHAWNSFPFCRTEYSCPALTHFKIVVVSTYIDNDCGEIENVFNVDEETLSKREVDFIDIATEEIDKKAYKEEEDPALYHSTVTKRGPLQPGWERTSKPVMTAYKLCYIEFKTWTLQGRIENFVQKAALRDTFVKGHKQVFCWIDDWYSMTIMDIRKMEAETRRMLAEKLGKEIPEEEEIVADENDLSPLQKANLAREAEEAARAGPSSQLPDLAGIDDSDDEFFEPFSDFNNFEQFEVASDISGTAASSPSSRLRRLARPPPLKFMVENTPKQLVFVLDGAVPIVNDDELPPDDPGMFTKNMREMLVRYMGASPDLVMTHLLRMQDYEGRESAWHELVETLVPKGRSSVANAARSSSMQSLLFFSPTYRDLVACVIDGLNHAYTEFQAACPAFNGPISMIADSVGSVIAYDALTGYLDDESIKLNFAVDCFFALGSPLALVLSARRSGMAPNVPGGTGSVRAPACRRTFHLYNVHDSQAYRFEPLLDSTYQTYDAPHVPHYRQPEVAEFPVNVEGAPSVIGDWWGDRRIDYELQLHFAGSSAAKSSLSPSLVNIITSCGYWGIKDVAMFVLRNVMAKFGPLEASSATPSVPFRGAIEPSPWVHKWNRAYVKRGGANHRIRDAVCLTTSSSQIISAKFRYGYMDTHLEDEDVEVFMLDATTQTWTSLGTHRTSRRNEHSNFGDDKGGMVFIKLDGAKRKREPGCYPVRMVVRGDLSDAIGTLHVVERHTPAVVIDIDGAVTNGIAHHHSRGAGTAPDVQDGVRELLALWRTKGYMIVYISGRQDYYQQEMIAWLSRFAPPGVVCFNGTLRESRKSKHRVRMMTAALKDLAKDNALDLRYAYGSTNTNIKTYKDVGINPRSTFILGHKGGNGNTLPLKSYREGGHLKVVQALPKAAINAPMLERWVKV